MHLFVLTTNTYPLYPEELEVWSYSMYVTIYLEE